MGERSRPPFTCCLDNSFINSSSISFKSANSRPLSKKTFPPITFKTSNAFFLSWVMISGSVFSRLSSFFRVYGEVIAG